MERKAYPLEPLFGRVLSPFEQFLRGTTAGSMVLMAATVVALAGATLYAGRGAFRLDPVLLHAINEGLMTLFFLMVGLELKREMLVGELASPKDAALPVVAALGGMVVPALIYIAFNAGSPAARGWGIAMATDIAFAVGICVLLASRVPRALILFLTALAIADDLGAVLVIALFYTGELNVHALGGAAALCGVLAILNRGGVRNVLPYAAVGLLLWLALHESGLHATVAGVVLALAIPALPSHAPADFERRLDELLREFRADRRDASTPDDPLTNSRMAAIALAMEQLARAVQSPSHHMERQLAPWVTFVIVPLFALANAGIDLGAVAWADALAQPVTIGVVAGLVLGKFAGISLFSLAAVYTGFARLPTGVRWRHLLGAAWLAGIGFTMSLFISQLAYDSEVLVEQAKLGILLGSALSAVIGLAWLYLAGAPEKISNLS